jgi:hypothetical protein
MAIKWKSLDLNRKPEIIQLCEVGSPPQSEIGRLDGLTFDTVYDTADTCATKSQHLCHDICQHEKLQCHDI